MKTAAELQDRAAELRAWGIAVPIIHPDAVKLYTFFQLPHLVG